MASNADTFVVKLTFDGQLRRFPVAKGTTFLALRDQVVSMLGRAPEADIVLKYTDEEGDLITITSDLELNSALVPGQLLRLTAIEKKANVGYPPLDAPMADASSLAPGSVPDASAPPQGADVFRGFAYGCGRGMAGMDGSHQHPPMGPHRGAFGPRGGFGWRGRGGHRGGFGPHGPHPHGPHHDPHHGPHHHGPHPYDHPFFRRGDMTPEEWHKAKKEHHKDHKEHKHAHKEAHKHMKKEWKAAHKHMKKDMKENGFPPGFETMGGMPWAFAPAGCGGKDRLVARYTQDLTIPDGSQIPPNTAFVKTWRLRNEGAEWPAGCALKFLGKHSDGLGAPEAVVIPAAVASDTEVDVSVNLVAPEKPGRYTGYWKMCTPEGKKFGQRVWVSIVVPSSNNNNNNNNSSSSDSDKEADRYEGLVDTVLAMGFNVKRHRIFRMLQKSDGDISLVCERLSKKQEKQARKEMKKGMKLH